MLPETDEQRFRISPERLLFGILLTIALNALAVAGCEPPHYKMGRVLEDTPAALDMFISIDIGDFGPKSLACLAHQLGQRYQDREKVSIYIFSTNDAAQHFILGSPDPSSLEIFERKLQLHAAYFYDKDKREEYVLLMPDALRPEAGSPLVTRIDLPAQMIPDCRLQISHRCLIAFQDARHLLRYPDDALSAGESGSVVLTARITRLGEIKDVQQVEIDSTSNKSIRPGLATSALENLKTWRFEPAHEEQRIRITYLYEIGANDKPALEFELPAKVTIRTKLPH